MRLWERALVQMAEGEGGGAGANGTTPAVGADPATAPTTDSNGAAPWYTTLADEGLHTNPALQRYKSVDEYVAATLGRAQQVHSGETVDPDTTPWPPEEFRDNAAVKRYKTQHDYIQGTLEREKLIHNGVQLPGEEATPEQWQEFYGKLGRPATPDDYTVAPPEIPAGLPGLPEGRFESFLTTVHQAGLRDAQVQPILDWYATVLAQDAEAAVQEQATQRQRSEEAVRDMWGVRTDHNTAIAIEGLRREFGAEGLGWLTEVTGTDANGTLQMVGNSPQFLKIVHEWAMSKGHDRFVPGGRSGAASQEEAQQRIASARQQLREGKITGEDFTRIQQRYGPLAYGSNGQGDDVMTGRSLTAADFVDTDR